MAVRVFKRPRTSVDQYNDPKVRNKQAEYRLFIDSSDAFEKKEDKSGGEFEVQWRRAIRNVKDIEIIKFTIPHSFYSIEGLTLNYEIKQDGAPVVGFEDEQTLTAPLIYMTRENSLSTFTTELENQIRPAVQAIIAGYNDRILDITLNDVTDRITFALHADLIAVGQNPVISFDFKFNDENEQTLGNTLGIASDTVLTTVGGDFEVVGSKFPDLKGADYIYVRCPDISIYGGKAVKGNPEPWQSNIITILPCPLEGSILTFNKDFFTTYKNQNISSLNQLSFSFFFHDGRQVNFNGEKVAIELLIRADA